jgi:hypothetical protein
MKILLLLASLYIAQQRDKLFYNVAPNVDISKASLSLFHISCSVVRAETFRSES